MGFKGNSLYKYFYTKNSRNFVSYKELKSNFKKHSGKNCLIIDACAYLFKYSYGKRSGSEVVQMVVERVRRAMNTMECRAAIIVFDKPYTPINKIIEQRERSSRSKPLSNDFPINATSMPPIKSWSSFLCNSRKRNEFLQYVSQSFAKSYPYEELSKPGQDKVIFVDSNWNKLIKITKKGYTELFEGPAIGEGDILVIYWIKKMLDIQKYNICNFIIDTTDSDMFGTTSAIQGYIDPSINIYIKLSYPIKIKNPKKGAIKKTIEVPDANYLHVNNLLNTVNKEYIRGHKTKSTTSVYRYLHKVPVVNFIGLLCLFCGNDYVKKCVTGITFSKMFEYLEDYGDRNFFGFFKTPKSRGQHHKGKTPNINYIAAVQVNFKNLLKFIGHCYKKWLGLKRYPTFEEISSSKKIRKTWTKPTRKNITMSIVQTRWYLNYIWNTWKPPFAYPNPLAFEVSNGQSIHGWSYKIPKLTGLCNEPLHKAIERGQYEPDVPRNYKEIYEKTLNLPKYRIPDKRKPQRINICDNIGDVKDLQLVVVNSTNPYSIYTGVFGRPREGIYPRKRKLDVNNKEGNRVKKKRKIK